LFYSKLDSIGLNLLVIVLYTLQSSENFTGDFGFSKLKHPLKSVVTKNRHYSGYYETVYSCGPALCNPVVENAVVVEELSDDEICACVDFFLQMLDIV
jgi:hypothetical protein